MKEKLACAVIASLLAITATADAAAPEQKLLARMKNACGGSAWDRVRSWHETSTAEIKGMPVLQNDVWHDLQSLKSAMSSVVNGRLMRRSGFNGIVAWQAGPDGKVRVQTDDAELRRQRRDVYLSSFGWFFPTRFPATIERVADAHRDGETFPVLHITPQDADAFDLWIDRKTDRVRRIEAGSEYAELSDYKTFDGVCTATIGRQGDQQNGSTVVLHVLDVQTKQPAPTTVFNPPTS